MTAPLLSGYKERPESTLHASVGGGGVSLHDALEAFRQDYSPVLRIVIPRRRARRCAPQSPFLKQR